MYEVGVLYKEDIVPFEIEYKPKIGVTYCNEEGHKMKYLGDDKFEWIKRSPLHTGEIMSSLSNEIAQKTFWALHRNTI